MEFFYFPAYHDMDDDLRRRHRQYGFDVCDQIAYHLFVLKQPTPDSEFKAMIETMELFESPYVELRRVRERCDRLEADNRELALHNGRLEADNRELALHNGRLEAENHDVSCSNAALAGEADRSRGEATRLRTDLEDLARSVAALRGAVSGLEESLSEERRRLALATGGMGWMVLDAIHRGRRVLAPPGTRRGRLAGAIWALPRRALRRGVGSRGRAVGSR